MKKNNILRSLFVVLFLTIVFYSIITKLINFRNPTFLLRIKPLYLGLAFISWALLYLALGLKFKILLKGLKYKFNLKDTLRFGAIGNFSIHLLPVGNFGESVLNFYLLRKEGVKTASLLTLFLIRLIFDYLAFFVLLLLSLATLKTEASLSPLIISAFFFLLFILITGIFFLGYCLNRPLLFKKISIRILKSLKKTFNLIKNKSQKDPKAYFENLSSELFVNLKVFLKNKKIIFLLFINSLFFWILDCGILFLCLHGLNLPLNFRSVFFSYGIATIGGIISLMPAGIGVIEGLLILTLSSFSSNLPSIALGVFGYRFISLWLSLPLGFFVFWSFKKMI